MVEENLSIDLSQLGAPLGSELNYLILDGIVQACYISDGSKAHAARKKGSKGMAARRAIPITKEIDKMRSLIDYDDKWNILGIELLFINGSWTSIPKLRERIKDTAWYIWVALAVSGWISLDRRAEILVGTPGKGLT